MKILVADDEIHMLEFMSEFLGKMNGHEVVLVENPREGLDKLTDDCDIVITDHDMGSSISGAMFAAMIRGTFPNMPIIMISGRASIIKRPPEVDILIQKPFQLTEILLAIEEAIKMHQPDVLQ